MGQVFPNFTRKAALGTAAPIQTAKVAFAGTGAAQQITLAWDMPFADTDYVCVWSVEAPMGAVGNVYEFTKTADGIVAQVVVNFGQAAVLHAIAIRA